MTIRSELILGSEVKYLVKKISHVVSTVLLLTTIEVTDSMTCEINSKPERGEVHTLNAVNEDTEEIITSL